MKLFGKLEKLTRMILTRNAAPGTIESNTTEVYADNTSGKPKVVVDVGGSETTYHVPVAEGATSIAGAYTTTLTVTNTTGVTLPTTGTLATLAGAEELSSKKLTGGTASTSNQWTIPNKSDITSLTDNVAGNIVYDTTAKKLKVSDGSGNDAAWKIVGGGLIPVELTAASFTANSYTAASGYHYLVDMAGAGADQTIVLPAGAAEAVVRISVVNNLTGTWKLIIDGSGSETIFYNDTANTTVNFVFEEGWAELSYDVGLGSWVVNDGSSPISGTFAGSLIFTGQILAADGTAAAPGVSFSNEPDCGMYKSGTNEISFATNGALKATLIAGNGLYVRDAAVDHGLTGVVPTDVYGSHSIVSATDGGYMIRGLSDTGATAGLYLSGIIGSDNPTDTVPGLVLRGSKKNTTSAQTLGAAETVLQIQNHTTELVTVLGNGNVGIGTASPTSGKVQIEGAVITIPLQFIKCSETTGTFRFIDIVDGAGSRCGDVVVNTDANTMVWGTSSDERLKINFRDFNALDIVGAVIPVKYERKCYLGHDEIGFTAQNLHSAFPEAVTVGGEDANSDPWMVDYGRITPVLVKAIQELSSKLNAALSRIDELEGK